MKPVEVFAPSLSTAESLLLAPAGLDTAQVLRLVQDLFTHQVDFGDAYFEYTASESWSLEEGKVKGGSFSIDQGVGVRAVAGEKTAFSYSDEITAAAIAQAVKTTRSIAAAGASKQVKLPVGASASSKMLYGALDPLATLDSNAKVALLEKIERITRAKDPRVKKVMANLASEYSVVLIVRSDGRIAADVRPLVRMNVQAIVEQNGRREEGYNGGGGRQSLAMFDDAWLDRIATECVASALTNLDARPAPAGPTTVVLGSGWPGILLHEAVGHGLEGDAIRKNSSVFAGMVGKRVAAKGVTVLDDGTMHGRRGSLNVDDEGNPSQRNVLIEDGILKGYMQDTLNARLMKEGVTGNARRESFAHLPMPRMTNTYMLGGDHAPEEILASVKDGIYCTSFGGGQVDPTSGKFVFGCTEAWKIENGKKMYPVKGATLIGNGPESLKYISMIGNDMAMDDGIGVCGKEGQSVPVGVGQPTLRIDNMTVGGTG
jgi:TldD protein